MPLVRAKRGVCIGVERHLLPGETAEIDAGSVQFLTAIGAVEVVPDPVPETAEAAPVESKPKTPAKAGGKE